MTFGRLTVPGLGCAVDPPLERVLGVRAGPEWTVPTPRGSGDLDQQARPVDPRGQPPSGTPPLTPDAARDIAAHLNVAHRQVFVGVRVTGRSLRKRGDLRVAGESRRHRVEDAGGSRGGLGRDRLVPPIPGSVSERNKIATELIQPDCGTGITQGVRGVASGHRLRSSFV